MYYLFSIFICLEFGPVDKLRSGTRRLLPTLCPGTAPTTKHVYFSNHARGLVDYYLRCARRLRRPPSTFTFLTTLGDCTDHRALYARGLVDQPAQLKVWRLYRPPSIIRSGTGRLAHPFESLGTVSTSEHDTLGDWSTSLLHRIRA